MPDLRTLISTLADRASRELKRWSKPPPDGYSLQAPLGLDEDQVVLEAPIDGRPIDVQVGYP